MPTGTGQLPEWRRVDVGRLESVFQQRATSYKYLFLKAILTCLKHRGTLGDPSGLGSGTALSFAEIRDEMLVNAWVPSRVFMLNLGTIDQIDKALKEVQKVFHGNSYEPDSTAESVRNGLRKYAAEINAPRKCPAVGKIPRWVPYRFLTPWFAADLRGMLDNGKNSRIAELSRERFDTVRPLYRISQDRGHIELHPAWLEYLDMNYGIVDGWLDMQWIKYLQNGNPNVPALSTKIWALPAERDTSELSRKRKFWSPLLEEGFECIYTGRPVPREGFDLDHFMPWTWVAHDQLWNLVPTASSTNREKGARIPYRKRHIEKLAEAHIRMLDYVRKSLRKKNALPGGVNWSVVVNDYGAGLDLPIGEKSEELQTESIRNAYLRVIEPGTRMAINRGFQKWM